MLIGDMVYERDSETGEVLYDLPMGTVIDFYYDDEVGETRFRVRWDGDKHVDTFGYFAEQLKKEPVWKHSFTTDH